MHVMRYKHITCQRPKLAELDRAVDQLSTWRTVRQWISILRG